MLRKCKVCRYVYLPSARYNHCPTCGAAVIGKLVIDVNTNKPVVKSIYVRKDYIK